MTSHALARSRTFEAEPIEHEVGLAVVERPGRVALVDAVHRPLRGRRLSQNRRSGARAPPRALTREAALDGYEHLLARHAALLDARARAVRIAEVAEAPARAVAVAVAAAPLPAAARRAERRPVAGRAVAVRVARVEPRAAHREPVARRVDDRAVVARAARRVVPALLALADLEAGAREAEPRHRVTRARHRRVPQLDGGHRALDGGREESEAGQALHPSHAARRRRPRRVCATSPTR